jgi:hypothetical protein
MFFSSIKINFLSTSKCDGNPAKTLSSVFMNKQLLIDYKISLNLFFIKSHLFFWVCVAEFHVNLSLNITCKSKQSNILPSATDFSHPIDYYKNNSYTPLMKRPPISTHKSSIDINKYKFIPPSKLLKGRTPPPPSQRSDHSNSFTDHRASQSYISMKVTDNKDDISPYHKRAPPKIE